jgi:hypothetical protein
MAATEPQHLAGWQSHAAKGLHAKKTPGSFVPGGSFRELSDDRDQKLR